MVRRSRSRAYPEASFRRLAMKMPAPATTNAALEIAFAGSWRNPIRYGSQAAVKSIQSSMNHDGGLRAIAVTGAAAR